MKNFSNQHFENDIKELIEDTFDTCISNKDEIRWLITLLRGVSDIPRKRTEEHLETYALNKWQYDMYQLIQLLRIRWKCAANGKTSIPWRI